MMSRSKHGGLCYNAQRVKRCRRLPSRTSLRQLEGSARARRHRESCHVRIAPSCRRSSTIYMSLEADIHTQFNLTVYRNKCERVRRFRRRVRRVRPADKLTNRMPGGSAAPICAVPNLLHYQITGPLLELFALPLFWRSLSAMQRRKQAAADTHRPPSWHGSAPCYHEAAAPTCHSIR